jgi:hypothetical protein
VPSDCVPVSCDKFNGTNAECNCDAAVKFNCASVRKSPGLSAGFRVRFSEYWLLPVACNKVDSTSGETAWMFKFVRLVPGPDKTAVMFVKARPLCSVIGTKLVLPASTLVDPRPRKNSDDDARTMTVNCCVALKDGVPLSLTMTEMMFVLGAWLGPGRHWKMPATGSIVALAGAPAPSEKVSVRAGTVSSVAELVKINRSPSVIV